MISLYACVGGRLTHYRVDVEGGSLESGESIDLPHDIPYAWINAAGSHLYAASSDTLPKRANPGVPVGTDHRLFALKIAADGALSLHGESVLLPARPVHLCTDIPSKHVLVAYNRPSDLKVYALRPDGSLGGEVPQKRPRPVSMDAGIFAHQVRVTPDNRLAILVTRGNDPEDGKPEDPGALKIFRYDQGRLGEGASVAPNGGYGFGARHLDFHPTQPWLYVSIERQNKMAMFRRNGDVIEPEPAFIKDTLLDAVNVRPRQVAGTVHVHPSGKVVYGVNRAYTQVEVNGRKVLAGGENNIVVYGIDRHTGEPTVIQHVDTRGVSARTFRIDPSGRLMVVANCMPMDVQKGASVRAVPASLALFRIAPDGTLDYLRKYDVEVGKKMLYWVSMV